MKKEHLLPLPNESIMKSYLEKPIFRKVSHESMIEYKGINTQYLKISMNMWKLKS